MKTHLRSRHVCSESATQGVALALTVSAAPRNVLDMKILGCIPRHILNQKLWRRDPAAFILTHLQEILRQAQVCTEEEKQIKLGCVRG